MAAKSNSWAKWAAIAAVVGVCIVAVTVIGQPLAQVRDNSNAIASLQEDLKIIKTDVRTTLDAVIRLEARSER